MTDPTLLFELLAPTLHHAPSSIALTYGTESLSYEALGHSITQFAQGLMHLGTARSDRVAIYLDKRFETVIASFGTAAAGAVFVPVNPLLKPDQVAHILRDCNVRVLVTSPERAATLQDVLPACTDLRHLVLTDDSAATTTEPGSLGGRALCFVSPARCAVSSLTYAERSAAQAPSQVAWQTLLQSPAHPVHRVIDTDMAAILYTSGSTGQPKGVVLSHRNMVAGAKSVASYLGNHAQDTLLAALPLSFDAGFSQLTTAFLTGARVVLLNYLLPRDVLNAMQREQVTGLTAVPPLYIQLARLDWPAAAHAHLRYFANTGGHMPRDTLAQLRQRAPHAQPFLMYGLTEAFRSTYLHPDEVDRRPDSMGKAIPNADVLVLRDDGSPCSPNEPGELVHRGALVSQGYWNDPEKTAERFKLLPTGVPGRPDGLPLPEYAVFSGDTVRQDAEGFFYFLGRRDEMIKTSGYRVSPVEVEEVVYASQLVGECVAFGVPHADWGSAIQIIATKPITTGTTGQNDLKNELLSFCRAKMPSYMVPAGIAFVNAPLPRNPNGKIDRKLLAAQWLAREN